MRVLVLVDHAIGTSGPHRNVVGSLNALGARDDISVCLLTGAVDDSEPYARAKNLEIRLGFQPHNPWSSAGNLRRLRQAGRGCDVVYVPTNLKSLLYAQFVRKGRRLVAGPNVSHLPIRRADSPGLPELSWLCDLWIEASCYKRDHVIGYSGASNVRCVRHAINPETFSPEHRSNETWVRLGISGTTLKVLYVGRDNEPRKGVAQLLHAIEQLNREGRGGDLDFILTGQMSSETMRRTSGVVNVHQIGFRKGAELAAVYAASDIAVVPSSWENMPFSVLEAMASGLSVIASRSGGIPEQIVDGESGILVDIADRGCHRPDAGTILARAIASLADDPQLREQLGRGARRRVFEHFSEARLGAELIDCFLGIATRAN